MIIRTALSKASALLLARLHAAQGWRRPLWAFGFGSIMALAMPPFNLFPLLWLCLPALIALLQGAQNTKQAFMTGWGFAFGFLVFSLYWIAASMLVDLEHFWWAIPLSVAGLPALFGLYYGIAAMIAWRMDLTSLHGVAAFALLWFGADFARGHMFTGFPWNLIGYTWSGTLPMLQITSLTGIYGLSLITTVAACLPAAFFVADHLNRRIPPKRAFGVVVASLVMLTALAVWGQIRISTTLVGEVPNVRIRLVQPNISQKGKWLISERDSDFDKLLALTSRPSDKPITHVIWPEAASTFYLSEDALHRQLIARHIPAAATVLTGVIRRDLDAEGDTRFYNSLVAIDGLGRMVAGYDKTHLVPFGEFMPWRRYLPPSFKALAAGTADFTPGDGARSLRVLGLPPFSPLICYEIIFPGKVTDLQDRPEFLVNVTNDAWYGDTIGPYQHFAIARVRAIEEGLPLLRAANTGISGVFDPVGRLLSTIDLDKEGIIDTPLPSALSLTFFSEWRDMPLYVGCTIIIFYVFLQNNKKHRRRTVQA